MLAQIQMPAASIQELALQFMGVAVCRSVLPLQSCGRKQTPSNLYAIAALKSDIRSQFSSHTVKSVLQAIVALLNHTSNTAAASGLGLFPTLEANSHAGVTGIGCAADIAPARSHAVSQCYCSPQMGPFVPIY